MLRITIPGLEYYDEEKNEFTYYDEHTIDLEHSLVSISKWEAKWCKPFLTNADKSALEVIDYVRCMTVNEELPLDTYTRLTEDNLKAINEYIGSPMTATTFAAERNSGGREIITSEIIYYWMVSFNIPFECQYWHLNRLLTLIKVCNVKNNPPKKMSKQEILARNRALNEARKREMNTRG